MSSAPQRGPFITGLVSFRVEDAPTFHADVFGFNLAVETAPIVRTKRGDVWRRIRQGAPGAGLILSGRVKYLGYPLPNQFKGVTGSVVLKYRETAKATVQIRVLSNTMGVASKTEQDTWDISFTCEVTAMPALTGWNGTQVAVSQTVAYDAAETHEGVTKGMDPDTLQDVDTVRYDLEGLLDTHTDETDRLTALVAAQAATRSGMKVRSAAFQRTDPWGGVVVITLARTTTAEDVVNAGTTQIVDPNKLATGGTVAAINATPAIPTITGQTAVERSTSTKELNDSNSLKTTEYAQRTTAEDRTMPGTWTNTDPLGIDTQGLKTEVYDTSGGVPAAATPPSGTQLVASKTEEVNRDRSQRTTTFEVLNSQQKRTYPKIHTYDDAQNIADEAIRAEFWTVGDTPPALPTPAPTNNVKLIGFDDVPITPTQNMRVWAYGPRNSRDQLVLPNYETVVDPQELEATAIRAVLDGEALSAPIGIVLRTTKTVPVTVSLGVNRELSIYFYGPRNTKQDIEFLQSRATAEPGNVRKQSIVVKVLATATPVTDDTYNPDTTNLAFWSDEVHQVTDAGKYVHVITYKPLAPIDEAQESFKQVADDPVTFLIGDDRRRVIDASATTAAPTVTAVGTGQTMVCVRRLTQKIGRTLYQHDFWYAFRSAGDQLEADKTRTLADVGGLKSESVTADLYTTGAAPSDPGAPSGLKLIDKTDLPTANPSYTLRVYRWGKRTSKDEIEKDGTETHVDPQGLKSWQKKTLVNATPSVDSGYQLVDTTTQPLNDFDTATQIRGELVNTKQRVEHDNTSASYPSIEPPRRVTASVVSHAGTAAALAATLHAANKSSLTFLDVEVEKVNNDLALQKLVETDTYLLYSVSTRAERRTVYAELLGGAVYVKLDRIIQKGTSLYDVLIAPQTRIARTARLALRRKVNGDPLALNLAKQGLVNAAEFLGLPANTVLYVGRDAKTNLAITGGRSADQFDILDYDSLGHFSTVGVIDGWFPTTADLSSKADGDKVTAATFGWTEAVGTAATDLSALTTP